MFLLLQNQALSLTCSKSPPSPIPECSTLKQEGNAMYAKDQLAEGKAGISKYRLTRAASPVACPSKSVLSGMKFKWPTID